MGLEHMALQPGATLGPYEILGLIGAGGMGEVYRARDPRLGREVAIKILPHDRVADEGRRQRFVQEAKAASALNHPHVVTIHEIASANGIDFLVMEYVRGKSLDALIPRQGMRLNEALRIAIAVADAMAAAHARGIIHRDLKPANVMVGTDGAVKVLDFGLAKLLGGDAAPDDETVTRVADAGVSAPGTIVGTSAYMSPEQATGAAVDARSDLFSFGALLYEMVTGRRAFPGTSTVDTLAAVVRAEPKRPTEVTPGMPPDLEKVILRCLRKEPERRFQHIDDVKVALDEVKEESESGPSVPASRARSPRRLLTAALVGSVVLMACVGVWLFRRPLSPDAPPLRVTPLTTLTGSEAWPTFSPDAEQIAFAWDGERQDNLDIYVKIIGSAEVRRLTTDAARDLAPSWSPDGKAIAFIREHPEGSFIHLVSALGGTDRRLSGVPVSDSLAWSPDGRYIAAPRYDPSHPAIDRAICLIPAEGGELRTLVSEGINSDPAFSPDGHRVAYISCVDAKLPNGCAVDLLELDAAYAVTGPPRRLTRDLFFSSGGLTWSRDGRSLIYAAAEARLSYLWRVGIEANQAPQRLEVAGMNANWPATSRARDRLVFSRDVSAGNISRFQVGRPPQLVLSSTLGGVDGSPDYSPDGQRIAFWSNRSGDAVEIWVAAAEGSAAHQLTQGSCTFTICARGRQPPPRGRLAPASRPRDVGTCRPQADEYLLERHARRTPGLHEAVRNGAVALRCTRGRSGASGSVQRHSRKHGSSDGELSA